MTGTPLRHPGPQEYEEPIGPRSATLTLLTAALWGATPVAVKYSLDKLPPIAVSGIRFALAAFFMVFWCRIEGSGLRLRRHEIVPSVVMGVLLFVQIALFTVAIDESNASHSTVLINTYVFWVAGIEHFITRTLRLTPVKIMGLVLAAAGGLIILVGSEGGAGETPLDPATRHGDLIMLASAFVLGIKTIYTKQAARVVEPGKLILWHDVVGVILFAAWSVAFEDASFANVDVRALLGLFYQGVIIAGMCFAIQAYLLRRHSASKISIYSFATPLFGIVAAWAFRGDRLSPWLFVSAACVGLGILIVNVDPTPKS